MRDLIADQILKIVNSGKSDLKKNHFSGEKNRNLTASYFLDLKIFNPENFQLLKILTLKYLTLKIFKL